jgi:hypothetical protein
VQLCCPAAEILPGSHLVHASFSEVLPVLVKTVMQENVDLVKVKHQKMKHVLNVIPARFPQLDSKIVQHVQPTTTQAMEFRHAKNALVLKYPHLTQHDVMISPICYKTYNH